MFFAMNSIFIGIATMLYVFDISKSQDERGREIVPEVDFRGFIRCVPFRFLQVAAGIQSLRLFPRSHPVPFRCEITPRCEEATALIRRAAGEE